MLIETPIIPCRDFCPFKFCMIGTICKFNNYTWQSECVRKYVSFSAKKLFFCLLFSLSKIKVNTNFTVLFPLLNFIV